MIEGIPDGWELVAFRRAVTGDYFLNTRGLPEHWTLNVSSGSVFAIIRKIEKPKRYRPFANAAEFEPHRDRWLMHPSEPDKRFAPGDYNNQGVWGMDCRLYDYIQLFESGTLFDDGTPFGIEVTE